MAARHSVIAFTGALIVFPFIALSAHEERIREPIDNRKTVAVRVPLHADARPVNDRGAVEPWTLIHDVKLALQPSAQQAEELEQLLESQRDPASADYQHWLSPEEFGDRFGLSDNDLGKITAWLQSEGFSVDNVARARNWVTFSGTAEQMGRTFRTQLRRYQSADGELHFANAMVPSIPASLAGVVAGVRGLDDFRPRPPWNPRLRGQFNSSGGSHYVGPDDLATIYDIAALYKAGFDGTGQKLVIAGQTNINVSDIRAFRSQFNLAAKDPQMVLVGTNPGIRSGDAMEADLDIEWAGAVARNATIVYVYAQNVFDSVQYAIDQNLAPVISLSYGACEAGVPASYRSIAQQANAQGITWLSAAGDSGAAGCDAQGATKATYGPAIIFPANIPEVTAVGGTEFNEGSGTFWNAQNSATGGSAISYIPERAWNDTTTSSGIEGTGGGASTVFAKPWWQAGTGVPNDNARDIPDVSLTASAAHDGYVMYTNGSLMSVGGTSASTPAFAGIVTLINQYVVAKGVQAKVGLGNINPTLYSLAKNTSGIFHDVTVGDNIVPCTTGTKGCTSGSFGYKAGPGYDLVTGLGSVDAYNLVTKWATLPPAIGTTMTLTASPATLAQSSSTKLTATMKAVTGSNVPTGSVSFSLGTTALGSATLALGVATLTINGTALSTGSNTVVATYATQGNFASATASTTVTLTAPPSVATTTTVTSPLTSIVATGTALLTATVKPASGTASPTGSVKFTAGNTVLGTATLTAAGTNAIGTITVPGSSLTIGNNTITASYVPTGNFATSTGTTTLNVTASPIATTTIVSANPTTIAPSASTQLTATVKAGAGTQSPTGSITFSLGGAPLGSANLVNGVATLIVKGTSLAIGGNTVKVAYVATGNFAPSAGSMIVTVTGVATTSSLTANPTSIAAASSTVLTATVNAATGRTAPTGTIALAVGNSPLGSASLSNGIATLTVKGSSLATGANLISANYVATGSFINSTASITVNVVLPVVSTTTTVTATPTSLSSTGTTQLTATVKPGTGTARPTGTVLFAAGNTSFGSAPLVASGGTATATLVVKGSSLASGNNLIAASYSGATGFSTSTGSVTVTITASTPSKVVATVTPRTSTTVKGYLVAAQLQEQAGVATTITGFTINGTDYSSLIIPAFSTTQLPARATLTANLAIQWLPLPSTLVFGFSGTDVGGAKWTQTVSVATK